MISISNSRWDSSNGDNNSSRCDSDDRSGDGECDDRSGDKCDDTSATSIIIPLLIIILVD